MRHALIFEQSPPPHVPLPFFLVAPLFAIAAFALLALAGPESATLRWDGRIIAALHLLTLGYLLPNMMAAVLQMTPVLTGHRPLHNLWDARILRITLFAGALLFAAGLYTRQPHALHLAFFSLATAAMLFVWRATRSIDMRQTLNRRGPGRQMLLAIAGFGIAAALGLRLLAGHGWESISLPRQWTDVHAGWTMLGWIAPLIMIAGSIVIPMFQHTQPLPRWTGLLAPMSFTGMLLASFPATRLAGVLLAVVACVAFAVIVLGLQARRRNVRSDATVQLFRGAMLCLLAASGTLLWMLYAGRTPLLEFLAAVLFLLGFAMGCVMGMSIKIVPFLLRFHLQRDLWQLDLPARNIPCFSALLPERLARWSARGHLAGVVLLALAVITGSALPFFLAAALLVAGQLLSLTALWHAVHYAHRLRRQFHAVALALQEENSASFAN